MSEIRLLKFQNINDYNKLSSGGEKKDTLYY